MLYVYIYIIYMYILYIYTYFYACEYRYMCFDGFISDIFMYIYIQKEYVNIYHYYHFPTLEGHAECTYIDLLGDVWMMDEKMLWFALNTKPKFIHVLNRSIQISIFITVLILVLVGSKRPQPCMNGPILTAMLELHSIYIYIHIHIIHNNTRIQFIQ